MNGSIFEPSCRVLHLKQEAVLNEPVAVSLASGNRRTMTLQHIVHPRQALERVNVLCIVAQQLSVS